MEIQGPFNYKPITWPKKMPLHIKIGSFEITIHEKANRPKWKRNYGL